MSELTCPNCNVDADPEELKQNNLKCPTCGHDMSDSDDPKDEWDLDDGDWLDDEEDDEARPHAKAGDKVDDDDEEDEEDDRPKRGRRH